MSVSRINLSPDGPNFSRLAWGAWRLADAHLEPKDVVALVRGAVEMGVTTIDHADIYGGYTCEKIFGDALAGELELRNQLQIVTKCGIKLLSPLRSSHGLHHYDTSYEHIVTSAENSLVQLRAEKIDLLLIHRPDPLMDADETARALVDLKKTGKVMHFGVSNFLPGQFDLLASRLPFPLVTNQVQISVLHLEAFENGTVDQCQRLRIRPMAWSPLDGGRLLKEESVRANAVRETLAAIAKEHGATMEQIAIAWLLALPSKPVPVLGTCNLPRLKSVATAERFKLSREQWFKIWIASQGHDVP